jgi:hypothetical protein
MRSKPTVTFAKSASARSKTRSRISTTSTASGVSVVVSIASVVTWLSQSSPMLSTVDLQKLGYSMRVERSSVEDVKSRLQSAAKRKYEPLVTKKVDPMEGKR